MPHFNNQGVETVICQKCHKVVPGSQATWRPDITGHQFAGNVCSDCLRKHAADAKMPKVYVVEWQQADENGVDRVFFDRKAADEYAAKRDAEEPSTDHKVFEYPLEITREQIIDLYREYV